ncbi:hypothetical protein [Paraburkholderia sp. GAS334]|uniref:hypothetical protein n=1 Tax=Paraburkholderia sp. GAS334 TaxID=3035131 RepID=UPI003D2030A5
MVNTFMFAPSPRVADVRNGIVGENFFHHVDVKHCVKLEVLRSFWLPEKETIACAHHMAEIVQVESSEFAQREADGSRLLAGVSRIVAAAGSITSISTKRTCGSECLIVFDALNKVRIRDKSMRIRNQLGCPIGNWRFALFKR